MKPKTLNIGSIIKNQNPHLSTHSIGTSALDKANPSNLEQLESRGNSPSQIRMKPITLNIGSIIKNQNSHLSTHSIGTSAIDKPNPSNLDQL